ncbi:MAG: DUF4258 domain-containing protein [Myxococcaceae bacterium]
MSIRRIRRAVREGRYEFTGHCFEEMDEDDLTVDDVLDVLLRGELVSTVASDPRGTRYVLRGFGESLSLVVEVVCRFLPSRTLRIITVYAVRES